MPPSTVTTSQLAQTARARPIVFRVSSFLCFLLCLSACTRRETPVEEGIHTRTLLVGNFAEPGSLDPNLIISYSDMRVSIALFEGLTVVDEKTGAALPGAAEHWTVSPDGLTYTFHLRPNGRWSNGDRVTAGDFLYAFRRVLTPTLGSASNFLLFPIKNAEMFARGEITDFSAVGVSAPDDLTLRLELEYPTPHLPVLAAQHLAWAPLHRATIEKFGKMDARDSAWTRPGNLVGNGAFTLTEWRPHARIVVTKNPHYWGAADNRIERVVVFPIEKSDVEERAFRTGQLHITNSLPASKIPIYRRDAPELLRIDPFLSASFFVFNTTKPPLDNPKVRRALALALDRAAISARVFESASPPAHTLVPRGCGGYEPPPGQPTDFAAARALLAEAGYPGGAGLPEMALQVFNDDKIPKVGEIVQAGWRKELGVRITIEPLEEKTLLQNIQDRTFTLSSSGWIVDYLDPYSYLEAYRTGNRYNKTGWSSKAYDALLDEACRTRDAAARFALLQRAEEILLREAPIAMFLQWYRTHLLNPAVKNWEPSPLGLNRYHVLRLEK